MLDLFDQTQITLEESTHTYSVKGYEHLLFSSVTEWISTFFRPFDPNEVADRIINAKRPNPKYKGLTKEEIIEVWNKIGAAGTYVHWEIEEYLKTGRIATHPKSLQGIRWLHSKFTITDLPSGRKQLETEDGTVLQFFCEKRICSPEHQLAGTIDLLIYHPVLDQYIIVDWKTNEKIGTYGTAGIRAATATLQDSKVTVYSLQLGVYQTFLEQNYGVKVNSTYICHLNEDTEYPELIDTIDLRYHVLEMLEDRLAQKRAGNLFPVTE